jgi:hypothetical protein
MGAASHYNLVGEATTGGIWGWLIIAGGLIALVELNCLVGTQGATKQPLDSISGTITAGVVLWLVLIIIIWATVG